MAIGSKKYHAQIWKNRLWVALILFVCGLLSLSLYSRLAIQRDALERRQEVEEEKQLLESRYKAILEKKEYLQSEEGIEAEIRKNFDVAKEGEAVIILLEDETAEDTVVVQNTTTVQVRVRPWWKIW